MASFWWLVGCGQLSSGFEPTRSRALENADLCGTTSGTDGSIAHKPSLENRHNSRCPEGACNVIAST